MTALVYDFPSGSVTKGTRQAIRIVVAGPLRVVSVRVIVTPYDTLQAPTVTNFTLSDGDLRNLEAMRYDVPKVPGPVEQRLISIDCAGRELTYRGPDVLVR